METIKTFETKQGLTVTVTGRIITEKEINLDGHKVTVDCNEAFLDITLEGYGSLGTMVNPLPPQARKSLPVEYTHFIGKLALTGEQVELIQSVKDAVRQPARKVETDPCSNGLCPKCQTYCYGDCEA